MARILATAALASQAACGPLQDAREVAGDATQGGASDVCATLQSAHVQSATITPSAFPGPQQLSAAFDDGSTLRLLLPAIPYSTQGMTTARPTHYVLPGAAGVQFKAADGTAYDAAAGQIDGTSDGAVGDSITLVLSALSLRSATTPARSCAVAQSLTLHAPVANPPCSNYGLTQQGDGCYADPSTGDNAVLTCASNATVTGVKYCKGVNQTCQADAAGVSCRSKN